MRINIYCDECGELLNDTYATKLKDGYGSDDWVFCSEECLDDFIKCRVTKDVYVTEEGVFEE